MSELIIRDLDDLEDFRTAGHLIQQVWGSAPDRSPLNVQQLPAMAHAGCQISGAFLGDRMVGATMAFLGLDDGETILHSHVTGVDPGFQGDGIGLALKWYQRDWCLERDIDVVTWTFDPIVLANARFNLLHLGARGVAYLRNFYGLMDDELNRDDPTDRIVARWDLSSAPVVAAHGGDGSEPPTSHELVDQGAAWAVRELDGEPQVAATTTDVRLVDVPRDVVDLRRADPQRTSRWRLAVRQALETALDDGHLIGPVSADGALVTRLSTEGTS